jgi:dTDP-4-amino-4,6-dideoxygalactose transaminase
LLDLNITEDILKKGAKAVVAVHLYGQPANLLDLKKLCERYGALLLADAAQAHGSRINDIQLGKLNETSTYSFYPTKNLGALGDGGAIATNSKKVAKNCESIRNYGSAKKYHHDEYGFNSRLDDIQAKFLKLKLQNLEHNNLERNEIANKYIYEFNEIDELILPKAKEKYSHVWHLFAIRHSNRDQLQKALTEQKINTAIHYPTALPDQPAFRGSEYHYCEKSQARIWASQELSLPMFSGMTQSEVDEVVASIKSILK